MKDEDNGPIPASAHDTPGGRRRFLGAGSALAPAVLTLVSQPALGVTCTPPSKALSRNASVGQNGYECNGESPGNYKTHYTPGSPAYHWPSSPQPGDKFSSIFSPTYFSGDPTLLTVLNYGGSEDPEKVAFHLIAAYLNIVNGFVPSAVLSTAQVQLWWTQWVNSGFSHVYVSGVEQDATWLKFYLASNGIAP